MQLTAVQDQMQRVTPAWSVAKEFGDDPVTLSTFTQSSVRFLSLLPRDPSPGIPIQKRNYVRILRELCKRDFDFLSLELVIKQDAALCYTLLKYINSAYFGLRHSVLSPMHAMVLLGETEVKRWGFLALLTVMVADGPSEVLLRSLIRARMCELLAPDVGLQGHEPELFLMGLFSTLDVLIGQSMEDILQGMNISPKAGEALQAKESGEYRPLYDLVVSYEGGEREQCLQHASRLNLDQRRMHKVFSEALGWAEGVVNLGRRQSKAHNAAILG
jgi:c-di-GMP-related signal transduction protein